MGSKPVGISGSRASAILGLNKFQSQFEVWQRIMEEIEPGFNASHGYIMPDDPDNAPIRWGNAFESAVIELAEAEDGGLIGEREKFYSQQYAWGQITCHIDGRYESGTLHEGKTTNIFTFNEEWGEPGTDRVPKEYAIQCQHQMLCSGADEVILSVLVFPKRVEEFEKEGWEIIFDESNGFCMARGKEYFSPIDWSIRLKEMGFFHQYRIKANPKIQEKLLDLYREWWNNHVIAKKPPEPTSYEDVLRMLPEPSGIVTVEDDQLSLFRRYAKLGRVANRFEKAREQLKISILSTLSSDKVKDESAPDKLLFFDKYGNRLGSFGKGGFRITIKEEE